MPWKTILTVVTFAAAMLSLRSFDYRSVPEVWQMPLPKLAPEPIATVKAPFTIPGQAPQATSPHLVDPTHELDPFYASLHKGVAVVLHYGDSPTTADLITADARAMLQKQFGDAGSGYVLIARPWAWYGHRGVEMDASNWKIDVAGASELKDGLFGLGAATFRGSTGAAAHWKLKDAHHSHVEIAYLQQPAGGTFSFETKGPDGAVVLGMADTSGDAGPGYANFDLPSGSTDFTLRVTSGSVRLFGADFRKAGPGLVYSSLGVNGANITLLSRAMNGAHWEAQLRHYHPSLVVVAFGTNESGYPSFVNSTWGEELKKAVRRIQAALPDSAVLLMSPMDRGVRKTDGEIGTIETMPHLVDLESHIADEMHVAFFNTYQAMGGEGTMAKWYNGEPRLVGADFIHPLPGGARIVGELLYNALRDGYNGYKLRRTRELEAAVNAADGTGAPSGPNASSNNSSVDPSPRSDSSN